MTATNVVVIDYGIGNVFSVIRALERLGIKGVLTSDPKQIMNADKVILPGVGAFGRAASRLADMKLDRVIHDYVKTTKPFLGICVGMQLLMDVGEEFGEHAGLGIIPGRVRKLSAVDAKGNACRIPLIGWTEIEEARPGAWDNTPFSKRTGQNAFYFVHSYHAVVTDQRHCIAMHRLGDTKIISAVRHENVLGVQFHPEKSGDVGLKMLSRFLTDSSI